MDQDLNVLWRAIMNHGLQAVIVLIVGAIVIKILLSIFRKALERSKLDQVMYDMIVNIARIVLWVLLIMILLGTLNISTGPLVAVLGAVGAALALALRDSLSNVAGGLILLVTKPFSAGDEIQIGDLVGVVDSIDLLTTRMHSYDNKVIIIPNGKITNSIVINATRNDMRRVDTVLSVSYDADIELTKKTILEVIRKNPTMVMDPEPFIQLTEHGENGLIYKVGVWCRTEDRFDAQRELHEQVKNAFDKAGIDIPYPHMDVTVLK